MLSGSVLFLHDPFPSALLGRGLGRNGLWGGSWDKDKLLMIELIRFAQ